MKTSESIANIAAALVQFQGVVKNPEKKSINPHYRSRYAELDEIINTIRPALEKCGLAFIQNPASDEQGKVGVYTLLLHKSGEYIQFDPVYIPMQKATPHQAGAALTYAKRYSLGAALGIATEDDDDANSISPSSEPTQKATTKREQPKRRTDAERKRAGIDAIKHLKETKGLTEAEFVAILVAETGEMALEDLPLNKIVGLHKIMQIPAGELKELAEAHILTQEQTVVA